MRPELRLCLVLAIALTNTFEVTAICKFQAINSSYCDSYSDIYQDYYSAFYECHCGMNPGAICQGHDNMPGTPDYGDIANDYNVNNCGYSDSYGDYYYDVFQCVEDTETYDECQNDDDCKNGGIHGLCLGKDVSQQCKTHCVPTKPGFDICESDIPYFIRPGSTIRSPNYPNYYENNKECKMTIRFSADQKVKIELISFHTEGFSVDPLKVYDGPEGERIAYLDGSINSGDTYTSTGNAMYLEFSSDGSTDNSDSYSGFIIIAKAGKCSNVQVLHTVHWRDGDTGEYFYFNENEVDAMVGRAKEFWNGKEFDVYQSGSGNWSGSVILWKSDSDSAAHGRRKEGHAANQWAKGDIIDLQFCKLHENSTDGNMTVTENIKASCNPNFIDSENYTCQNYGSMGWCGYSWISNFTVNGEDASDCPECGCVTAVNGSWSSWQSWKCSKTCGGGMQERTRTCSNPPPAYGGLDCTASNDTTVTGDRMIETEVTNITCNNHTCSLPTEPAPIDCQLSKWTKFGPWVNGKQVRTRSIIQEALYGGKDCNGKLKDTKKTCWNYRSKKQCRMVQLKGKCEKRFWSQLCCRTCRPKGTCTNKWSNKKCRMLVPQCNRNRTVRKKCQAACKRC